MACSPVQKIKRYPAMTKNNDLRLFTLRTLAFTAIPALMLVQSAAAQPPAARPGGDPVRILGQRYSAIR